MRPREEAKSNGACFIEAQVFGMFVIFRGSVVLDFDVDSSSALTSVCGRGAIVGLPATLSRGKYSMTATVVDDANLGLLSVKQFFELLREQPALRQEFVRILSAKVAHANELQKAAMYQAELSRPQPEA